MSYVSHAHAVEHTRLEALSAQPDAPIVEDAALTRSDAARLALARLVRRAAAAQLRWARREERRVAGPSCTPRPA